MMKKGGGELHEKNTQIYVLLLNIFMLICNYVVIGKLYNNNKYDSVFYFFIIFIIVSFFTIVMIVLGIVNSKSSLFKYFVGDSNITQNDEEDSTTIYRIIALFVLTCSGLLQFISTALFVTVLNNRPPKTNNFELTQTNAANYRQYKLIYIFTYIAIIVLAIVIITPLSNSSNIKEVGFYYIILILSTVILIAICSSCFASCFAIYKNVIIDGNQLSLQDIPSEKFNPPNIPEPAVQVVQVVQQVQVVQPEQPEQPVQPSPTPVELCS